MTMTEKKLDKNAVETVTALTPMQEGLLFHYLKNPRTLHYFEQLCVTLTGHLTAHTFEAAWNRVVRRHGMLRTLFRWDAVEEPVQITLKDVPVSPRYYDLSQEPPQKRTRLLEEVKRKDREEGFTLQEVPFRLALVKLQEKQFVMLISHHHILYDGWSGGIILKEFFLACDAIVTPGLPEPSDATPETTFPSFVKWLKQRENHDREYLQRQKDFWTTYLYGVEETTRIPWDSGSAPELLEAAEAAYVPLRLEDQLKQMFRHYIKDRKTTPAAFFYSLWGMVLQNYCNSDDVVFGTTVSGRPSRLKGSENVVGLFIGTLPLRFQAQADDTVEQSIIRTQEHLQQREPFENTDLEAIRKWQDIGFDSLVVVENYPLDDRLKPHSDKQRLSWDGFTHFHTTHYTLTLEIDSREELNIQLSYDSRRIDCQIANAIASHVVTLLAQVLNRPQTQLRHLELLTTQERQDILADLNHYGASRFPEQSLVEMFQRQAVQTPFSIALTSEVQVSYRELDRRSHQMAAFLRARGVAPQHIVALILPPSQEMIIAILGILKAGAAYLPIDPAYPQDRIDYMLKDSNAILCIEDLNHREHREHRVFLNKNPRAAGSVPSVSSVVQKSPIHPAYIIYTSGTTGHPKGVIVEHRHITALMQTGRQLFNYGQKDVWTMFHSYCFDFSVWEMYGALLMGGRLVTVSPEQRRDPREFLSLAIRQQVTILNQTPAVFYRLIDEDASTPNAHLKLQYVIFGGDALQPTKLRPFKEKYPFTRLINMYGITETTVHVTFKELHATELATGTSNIGKPIATLSGLILDRFKRLVPRGLPGELYVGGAGVARGYLNRQELSVERFVPVDLNHGGHGGHGGFIDGARYYRSGDLVRLLPGGDMEYLGRVDHQVKVRGNRVELGEIQRRLVEVPEIKDAVVTLYSDEQHPQALCAYFTASGERGIPVSRLREQLARSLPEYMIPSFFIPLAAMPLTATGKIHRKQLPPPHRQRSQMDTPYIAPRHRMAREIAAVWQDVLEVEQVGIHDNFFQLGGTSIDIGRLRNTLQKRLQRDIPIVSLFQHPTVAQFIESLTPCTKHTPQTPHTPHTSTAPQPSPQPQNQDRQIAVIGMSGQFPGADHVTRFWQNLKEGRETITFFSPQELKDPKPSVPSVSSVVQKNTPIIPAKAILSRTDPYSFDAVFFNYTVRDAQHMDPQLRLLHHNAWAALEDAGYCTDSHDAQIGLYVGATTHLHWIRQQMNRLGRASDKFATAAVNDAFAISTQLAYRLNLQGPAITIQTACSTSLVAIHHACAALRQRTCQIALAGGVSLQLPEKSGYHYQEGMVFSPDGHCRPFDARAAGTVEGHGVGIVVLKPLNAALRDRDHIYAVVRGTAINNDGNRKVGFAAPSVTGQAQVIRMAQQDAGVEPGSISYIETHGTGTLLGDPVEIRALCDAFGSSDTPYCRIGSVKSNIGHLDSASGVAGFIKTVLSLYHRQLPPTLHYETPNPEIQFNGTPFQVNTQLTPWTDGGLPLRAGVSSFGIGGTNAHVIVEQAPPRPEQESLHQPEAPHRLVLFSAKTPTALTGLRQKMARHFDTAFDTPPHLKGDTLSPEQYFADETYTLHTGRHAFDYRCALVCRHRQEAAQLLSTAASKKVTGHRVISETPYIVFLYPGLGAQYVNMARDLYDSQPVFQEAADRCFQLLQSLMDIDFREILYPGTPCSPKPVQGFQHAQLAVFIVEYALGALLNRWGIRPDAVMGYSFGEYSAACAAGVLSLESALQLIVQRGKLVSHTQPGVMLSVPLSRDRLTPLIADQPGISLAIDNGPSCVVSGETGSIGALEHQLKAQRVMCMRLDTDRAIHSPLMETILTPFEEVAAQTPTQAPTIPYISNLTGTWVEIESGHPLPTGYWSRHLRQTVRFDDGIRELVKEPNVIFLEVGPGRDLSALVQRHLGGRHKALNLIPPAQQKQNLPDTAYLLERIGRLWTYGQAIDGHGFYENQRRYRVPLPTYPFEHFSQPSDASATSTDFADSFTVPDAPPRNPEETELVQAFQTLFGTQGIGIRDDFFQLGGDSLKAISLVSDIQQRMQVEVPLDVIFQRPTVEAIAAYLETETLSTGYAPIPPVEARDYYPLSPAQTRMYLLHRLEEGGVTYNMPSAMWIEGDFDVERLQQVCMQLIQRHESLRTSFLEVHNRPVQRIVAQVPFHIETLEPQPTVAEAVSRFIRSFDLALAPLWRVGVVPVEPRKWVLLSDLHHIIADDISIGLLITEMSRLYQQEPLAPLTLQYKEYARWQSHTPELQLELLKQKEFWLNYFSGDLPVLELPTDHPRPVNQRFDGANVQWKLDAQSTAQLHDLARQHKTTLFVVLFSLYNILLYKYTGQEDIIVGTPITGRIRQDLHQVVGMFVNTLALRNRPAPDKLFPQFLKEVKTGTIETFAHRLYPFEELVEQLNLRRDLSRNPLFDTMMVLHTVDLERIHIRDLKIKPYQFEHQVSRFDLTFNVSEGAEGLNLMLEYSTLLFEPETIIRFKSHWQNLLQSVLANPSVAIKELSMLSEAETRQILEEFNHTEAGYPRSATLHSLFEAQARQAPDRVAVVGQETLTYFQLNTEADSVASYLRQQGVVPQSIVALLFQRSVEMIVAILGVLKAGAAYLPIDPDYPQDRIDYMLKDSNAVLCLYNLNHREHREHRGFLNKNSRVAGSVPSVSSVVQKSPIHPAYIIYTSGTTGRPKGAVIQHNNVVQLLENDRSSFRFSHRDTWSMFHSYCFDFSVWEMYGALLKGGRLELVSAAQARDPRSFATLLQSRNITVLNQTPSAFYHLMAAILDQPRPIPLPLLRYIIFGGEALTPTKLKPWSLRYPHTRLINMYGITETTVHVTYKELTPADLEYTTSNIGRPLPLVTVHIVSPTLSLQPIGIPGQITVSGAGVCRGYLNRPELTSEKFLRSFFQKATRRRHYATGDLGKWLENGDILYLGRIDHQVKIRGYRIETAEIQQHILTHPAVKETHIMARQSQQGDKYLCAYILLHPKHQVTDPDETTQHLRRHLGRLLPQYMVPAFFHIMERFPLTPNGKLDRAALPEPGQTAPQTRHQSPQTATQTKLARLWNRVLERDNQALPGIEDNFFHMGGHSLNATMLASQVCRIFQIQFSLSRVFEAPTLGEMAHYIDSAGTSLYQELQPLEDKEYYPQSSAQKRLYFLDRFHHIGTSYHMPAAYELDGEVEVQRLQAALEKVIRRHQSLRTSFHTIDGQSVQRIHSQVAFNVETVESQCEFFRPFDLASPPLLRVGLQNLWEGRHLLFFDMHHIVGDGASLEILARELAAFYQGHRLEPLAIQYRDFAQWQNRRMAEQGQVMQVQKEYWTSVFPDARDIPCLELPLDNPEGRPAIFDFEGDWYCFQWSPEDSDALADLGRRYGTTLYMTLLAIFNVLLHKYSRQEAIVVGCGVQGRPVPQLQPVIGMFVNTLAMRNQPEPDKPFEQFLKEVAHRAIDAFENQDLQFEDLVELLNPPRNPSRNPIFDVAMVFQNRQPDPRRLDRLNLTPAPLEQYTSKLDLTLFAWETEEGLQFRMEYRRSLFKPETIERMGRHFEAVMQQVVKEPGLPIADIDMLSPGERRTLLEEFNCSSSDQPQDVTLHRLFEARAHRHPHRLALTCDTLEAVTYRQLNRDAHRLAAAMRQEGVCRGSIVALKMSRSIPLITAIWAVLKTGAAYLPIDPDYPQDRIDYMLKDSNAVLCIDNLNHREHRGHRGFLNKTPRAAGSVPSVSSVVQKSPIHPAYIIYTSGTTGQPKGVLIEHRNIAHYALWRVRAYGMGERDIAIQLLSPSFDGFCANLYPSLLSGGRVVLPVKEAPLDYRDIARTIHRQQVTHMLVVPSMFDALIRNVPSQTLQSFRWITLGGESSPKGLLSLIRRSLPHVRIANEYGPTESAVAVTYHPDLHPGQEQLIGKPIPNNTIAILAPNTRPVPIGIAGELHIAGPQVARGYLNRQELTHEVFLQLDLNHGEHREHRGLNTTPAQRGSVPSVSSVVQKNTVLQKTYKTGDLARWLENGTIQYLGRIDHQIKLRGYRIELDEIQHHIAAHPSVTRAVVLIHQDSSGDRQIVSYIVPTHKTQITPAHLQEHLAARLPHYMVPAAIKVIDALPLNRSGKVDTSALPAPFTSDTDTDPQHSFTPPETVTQKRLQTIWSQILGLESHRIGIDSNFFRMGGHSLKAANMVTEIRNQMGIDIPLAEIFNCQTIRQISRYLDCQAPVPFNRIPRTEEQDHYPLSPAQRRMYILQQIDKTSTVYNIPMPLILEGEVPLEKIEAVFRWLVARHESLRTSFHLVDREPMQRIHKEVAFSILQMGNEPAEPESYIGFIVPFDLEQAPLMRAGIGPLAGGKHLFLLDMHHIVSDGVSMSVIMKEFGQLLYQRALPELTVSYKDYACWLDADGFRSIIEPQQRYWQEVFTEDIPVLQLPLDYPRPAAQSLEGRTCGFQLPQAVTSQLNQLARHLDITLFMLLLALWNLLLSKLSRQEDIVIGTPVAGRSHGDLSGVVGNFINTLALRNFPAGEKGFDEFCRDLKEKSLAAFSNQDYPFEELVEVLDIQRDGSRHPLFDVMLVVQNMEMPELNVPGLTLKPYHLDTGVSRFDMTWTFLPVGEGMTVRVEYCHLLFKEETVQRFWDYFLRILESVAEAPEQPIGDIRLIGDREKEEILFGFNAANLSVPYPVDKTIHQLFEEQAARTPHRVALNGPSLSEESDVSLTYRQVDRQADNLAAYLQDKGIRQEDIVAVKLPRSVEMVIAMLGILKADAAYLPIDPDYPRSRIDYMLKDSNAILCIDNLNHRKPNEHRGHRGFLNKTPRAAGSVPSVSSVVQKSPIHIAYIIYTSGTTGKPKGTLIQHRNVVRLMVNDKFQFDFTERDTWTMFHSGCFDFSVWEMYGALLYGGQLVVVPQDVARDAVAFWQLMQRRHVTILNQTPSAFYQLMEIMRRRPPNHLSLRTVIFGGEALNPKKLKPWHHLFPTVTLINMYGITETTVHVTYKELHSKDLHHTASLIGHAIPTLSLYVLDPRHHLLPIGVPGELYVGGLGVARGYLNRPELTHEVFLSLDLNHGEHKEHRGLNKNPRAAGSVPSVSSVVQKLYKTGDLVKQLPDHQLEYLGRVDQQVKIRGFRIELAEIDARISACEGVSDALVTVRQDSSGDRYLCAYVVAEEIVISRIREEVAAELPHYMVPSFFVSIEKIPLTSNGKVNPKALPEPRVAMDTADDTGTVTAPQDDIEKRLVEIWGELLGTGIDTNQIGIDTGFFDVGGHSLKAVQLVNAVHQDFGIDIGVMAIFQEPTIRGQARIIRKEKTEEKRGQARINGGEIRGQAKKNDHHQEPIKRGQARNFRNLRLLPAAPKPFYPLSYAQKRLWVLHKRNPQSQAFNMPERLVLSHKPDIDLLKEVLVRLTERHESLRTCFVEADGEVMQKIEPAVTVEPIVVDLTGRAEEIEARRDQLLSEESVVPLDIERAPLFRVKIVIWGPEQFDLIINLHHLITDGWSMELLQQEFLTIYGAMKEGKPFQPEPVTIQYKDYALWHNRLLEDETALEEVLDYWRPRLSVSPPILDLPVDFPPQGSPDKTTAAYRLVLNREVSLGLQEIASDNQASLFMAIMALFQVWLWQMSRQEELLVALPGAARHHREIEHTIGLFVNTLVMRHRLDKEVSFVQLLESVRLEMMQILHFQDYPLELVCDRLKVPYPELSFFINMVNTGERQHQPMPELPTGHLGPFQDAKFPLVVYLNHYSDGIEILCCYYSRLFLPETIEKIMSKFATLAAAVGRDPSKPVRDYAATGKKKLLKKRK